MELESASIDDVHVDNAIGNGSKMVMSNRAYEAIRTLIEQHGSTMKYEKEGYEFGAWVIRIGGKTTVIEAPGNGSFPKLDRLYVPRVANPRGYADYTSQLVPDAEEKLWAMLKVEPPL